MTIQEVCRITGISQDTLRYYERVGAIPKVARTAGGIRNYQEEDLRWIRTATCLRSAGMSVESVAEYVRLYQLGDASFQARLDLLSHEREGLLRQKEQLENTLALLNFKISRYEKAVKTGVLSWERNEDEKN